MMKSLVTAALVLFCGPLLQAENTLEVWQKAARSLTAGQTLEVPNGTYTAKGAIKLQGLRGTAEKPITLRAAHRGKAEISGVAGFVLSECQHLVLEGFLMTHDADQQAMLLRDCQHVRVTRNTLRLTERAKPRHWEHWVTVEGTNSAHNRIDHNLFERKVNRGSHVFVRGDDPALVCSQHDRIDHNHFRDVIYANKENGHETIRTGGNDLGASGRSSFTIIEDNLLERCSGEDELMSIKSSDNIIRNNTLINCRGAICMRLANRCVVSGNFIIATEDGPAFGGVKLYGFEHHVFNNYFQGLTGRRHEAPFSLPPGTLNTPTTDRIGKDYDDQTSSAPTRCWIAHNTWVNCAPLQFGFKPEKDRPFTPKDNTFINNLVVRTRPHTQPLVNLEPVQGMHAEGNLAYATESEMPTAAWAQWFKWADPLLHAESATPEMWRLTEKSPAIDMAIKSDQTPDEDIYGRSRTGKRDVGAEEFSPNRPVRGLLTPADVGPDAL